MGYRIDYHASGAVLSAVVSGKSKYAARIARDIGAPARRRIAVLDVVENDRYYVFAEMLARSLGCTLRHFADATSAIRWLKT